MEKLMYLLGRPADASPKELHEALEADVLERIRRLGGSKICLQIADLDEPIAASNPERLLGEWDSIGAIVGFWLDSEHRRAEIEAGLRALAPSVDGYLVCEGVWQAEDEVVFDGSRRPGISQMGGLRPPPGMDDDAFFAHWEDHSRYSFDVHPLRDAYTRNTVVRRLTEGAPGYRALVLEHFPSLESFCDDALFFTDDAAAKKRINRHVVEMIDFSLFFSGGMSEYNYS